MDLLLDAPFAMRLLQIGVTRAFYARYRAQLRRPGGRWPGNGKIIGCETVDRYAAMFHRVLLSYHM